MVVVKTTLYEFPELSEGAKKVAMEEYREYLSEDTPEVENYSDVEIEIAMKKLGVYFHSNGKSVELWEHTEGNLPRELWVDTVVEKV